MGINDPRLASVKNEVKSLKEQVGAIAGSENATWDTLEGKPAVIAAGANAAAARQAIGAGTSNLAIGTTASTAKAGNYHPTWAQVTGKPAVIGAGADAAAARSAIGAGTGNSNLAIGTTASTAAAGNHNHDGDYATAADLAALVARVEALESNEKPR